MDQSHILSLKLLVKVITHTAKHQSRSGKQTRQHLGRHILLSPAECRTDAGLARRLEAFDEFARQSGGIDSVDIEVGFALAGVLVEAFADFEDGSVFLILVIVVAIVVVVVVAIIVVVVLIVVIPIILGGLHARNAFVTNDALAGVRQGLAVVELLVNALRGSVGADLVHEDAQEDGFAVGAAVGSDEELHILLLAVVVVVVVLVVIIAIVVVGVVTTAVVVLIVVVVVLRGVLVDFELGAFECILDLELFFLLAIVIVLVILLNALVVDASGHVALGRACIIIIGILTVTIVCYPLTLRLLRLHLILHIRHHKLIHINHIIPPAATSLSATIRRAKLEVHQALFVHAIVVVLVIIIIIVIVLIAAEVSAVVVGARGALFEFEGVVDRPGHVAVTSIETTGAV
mmetsp:Transcript_11691/g.20548  ORF Transcript_11691/g.20548 Transcript_11691/m.20548 type:complete len:403 (+) Transcript_11691:273-1481(+)